MPDSIDRDVPLPFEGACTEYGIHRDRYIPHERVLNIFEDKELEKLLDKMPVNARRRLWNTFATFAYDKDGKLICIDTNYIVASLDNMYDEIQDLKLQDVAYRMKETTAKALYEYLERYHKVK